MTGPALPMINPAKFEKNHVQPGAYPLKAMPKQDHSQPSLCLDKPTQSPAHDQPRPYLAQPTPGPAHYQASPCLAQHMPAHTMPSPADVQTSPCIDQHMPRQEHITPRIFQAQPSSFPCIGNAQTMASKAHIEPIHTLCSNSAQAMYQASPGSRPTRGLRQPKS